MPKEKRVLVSRQYSKRSQLGEFWYRFSQNKAAVVSLVFLTILLLICIFTDFLVDYETQVVAYNLKEKLQWPSAQHWFGTDEMGRDLFCRVIYGARYSMSIGVSAMLISIVAGVPIGAIVGYFGGTLDLLFMRVVDIVTSIPPLLMGVVIVTALGQSDRSLILALGLTRIAGTASVTRASVMTVKNSEYVESARAIGMPTGAIIARHILPNCLSPIIVRTTLGVAGAVVAASSLSYLGLGVPVPAPEWGALLSAGRGFVRDYNYLTLFPGFAIMLTVLALNMVGDALRDTLDPKLKK